MVTNEQLRIRIKKLEHINKVQSEKLRDYDEVVNQLVSVTKLYESQCISSGFSMDTIEKLRPTIVDKIMKSNEVGYETSKVI